MAISQATARFGGDFDNAGVVSISGGLLEIGAQTESIDPVSGNEAPAYTGFANTGTVIALDATVALSADETDAGLGSLALTDSTLALIGGTLDNTGATLDGSDGSLVGLVLEGGALEGGEIDLAGEELGVGGSGSDLDNVALVGTPYVNGAVELTGTTALYADDSLTTPGAIAVGFDGRAGFAGAGSLTLPARRP